jgi:uncharacterized RDD family membrane protein YckC
MESAMPMLLIGAIASLIVWIVFTFVIPLGPGGAAIHLLLGLAGVLFVRWWALKN